VDDNLFDFSEVLTMAMHMDDQDYMALPGIIEATDEEELKEIVWALDNVADNISHIFQVIKDVRPDFKVPSIS